MKVALLTDTHWGTRGDSIYFLDNMKKFLDNIFFPYLENNNIDYLIHLGDLVDRQKGITYVTAKRLREDFLEPLQKRGICVETILGNHDLPFKNTKQINSLHELIGGHYPDHHIVVEPVEINLRGTILLVPWIIDFEKTAKILEKSKAKFCLGHFELNGFEMYKGLPRTHVDLFDRKILDKFKMVCSGHFHHKSSKDNIHYLGAAGEYTWTDYDDPRGFHILDTETGSLEFIPNPYNMFEKIEYDGRIHTIDQFSPEKYEHKYVKIIVKHKTSQDDFNLFISHLEKSGAIDVTPIEDQGYTDGVTSFLGEKEDTISIMKNYIEQINFDKIKKVGLENLMIELYQEALTQE